MSLPSSKKWFFFFFLVFTSHFIPCFFQQFLVRINRLVFFLLFMCLWNFRKYLCFRFLFSYKFSSPNSCVNLRKRSNRKEHFHAFCFLGRRALTLFLFISNSGGKGFSSLLLVPLLTLYFFTFLLELPSSDVVDLLSI